MILELVEIVFEPVRRTTRVLADQPAGAVVELNAPPAANTGETTTVPPPHGAKVAVTTRWSVALGGVTSIDDAVGQVVSFPTGTSENPRLKSTDWPDVRVTADGAMDVKE
jgi:hypothetical protein